MPAKVLFVASNPTAHKFDFVGELSAIREAAARRRSSGLNLIARWSLSVSGLRSEVAAGRPDIVHLLSPGVDVAANALVLSDAQGRPEYAQPNELSAAFGPLRSYTPKLVVLNTCHSRLHGEAIANRAGCVIAMDGTIFDPTAIEFARELYSSLSFGDSVQRAFERARDTAGRITPEQADVPLLLPGRLDPASITFARRGRRPPVSPRPAGRSSAGGGSTCAKIFCSYSHKDEKYRAELETHLALLSRQGAVHVWHDRLIAPGRNWAKEIDDNINLANVVLLLVSADFLASEYCYGVEMRRALQRASRLETHVVPILIRKCDLQGVPFADVQWLPTGAKPVKNWADRDSAWTDVATGVRKIVQELGAFSTAALTR